MRVRTMNYHRHRQRYAKSNRQPRRKQVDHEQDDSRNEIARLGSKISCCAFISCFSRDDWRTDGDTDATVSGGASKGQGGKGGDRPSSELPEAHRHYELDEG